MKPVRILVLLVLLCVSLTAQAQQLSADELFYKLRAKLETVKDYVADVRVKIDVSYMRVPPLTGKLYFKAPGKMKLERNGGISIMPKKTMNMAVSNVVPDGKVTIIDAGMETINGKQLRAIKVVPSDDGSEIVLTKVWVDEALLLPIRTETTTRDNGTIKMELEYGKYIAQSLADKITFYMDVKDYKLPKGVTMDYDGATQPTKAAQTPDTKRKKGKIQIYYLNYKVNQGLSDEIFKDKDK
jgi:outer membrane lipoprotein-sorting protein